MKKIAIAALKSSLVSSLVPSLVTSLVSIMASMLTACSTHGTRPDQKTSQDQNIWLEDRTAPAALDWVKKENQITLSTLEADPHYKTLEAEVRDVVLAKDRLPVVSLIGNQVYNFWQDDTHIRGIWRRTTLSGFQKANVTWETVIDIDALAKKENENWVWKGLSGCLAPKDDRCLIRVSRGGTDADVVREFSLVKKDFVANGFVLPEAKSHITWINENEVYVATDFGPGTISHSSYPIVTKLWKRGTPLSSAVEVFRGEVADVSAQINTYQSPSGTYRVASRNLSFFTSRESYVTDTGKMIPIPLPESAAMVGAADGRLFYLMREVLTVGSKQFASGSLIALPISSLETEHPLEKIELVFAPTNTKFISNVELTKNGVIIDALESVKGRIFLVQHLKNEWSAKALKLPGDGLASTISASPFSSETVIAYSDFLTPSSILFADLNKAELHPTLAKQSPARFDATPFKSEQWFATSADGTKIPYFVVHNKAMKLDGQNPTLQYGYGGFEVSMAPKYLGPIGKTWLERGGVYVHTNIRGGGEFGPAWHQAALGVNRQKAYDDFIAISEDLIKRKVTSPEKLAIKGGSNGGLLVGATFVERPDLYKGVLCQVALLDMIRYPLLGAGASWVGEYGDPNDPKFREAILKYSPYQNVKSGVKYPKVFFMTATSDDRVMPSHARKMHALMSSLGYPTYFYENTDGGHAGNANLESVVHWTALEYTYLWRELGDTKSN